MIYSATITKTGQITVPKPVRNILGVKPGQKIVFEQGKDCVTITRRVSDDEFFAQLDAVVGEKAKKIAKKDGNKSTSEIMQEIATTPKAKAELEREYGN